MTSSVILPASRLTPGGIEADGAIEVGCQPCKDQLDPGGRGLCFRRSGRRRKVNLRQFWQNVILVCSRQLL
jgi:hypothetical protein